MRKLFLSALLSCLVVLATQAQETEHLQFMGIPINGQIKEFQSELSKKGFKRKSYASDGIRKYTGFFSGEDVELLVSFDKKTKNVYQVGVLIPCYTSSDVAEHKYRDYKYKLESKYNAYSISIYSSIYDNNGIKLEKDIKNGILTSLNSTREWISDEKKETCISISKPSIFRYSEGDTLHFASVFMNCFGNIGTITIKTFKIKKIPFSYYGLKYENGIFIIYEDRKNSNNLTEKNNDDL